MENNKKTAFIAETNMPTIRGYFRVRAYKEVSGKEPIAIIEGNVEGSDCVLMRVHDACFTSEVLGSMKCDCAEQLSVALDTIKREGRGLVIYLQQEGRGIGISNKIAAYALQEQGFDTVEANEALGFPQDTREYQVVKDILDDLHIQSVNLITNNPRKIEKLQGLGIVLEGRTPTGSVPRTHHLSIYFTQLTMPKKQPKSTKAKLHRRFINKRIAFVQFSTLTNHLKKHNWETVKEPHPRTRKKDVRETVWMNVPTDKQPITYFNLFWNSEILAYLIQKTNANVSTQDRLTLVEVKKYFGQLLVLMALKLAEIRDLWRTTRLEINYSGKQNGLTRDRWEWIHSNWYFNREELREKLITTFNTFAIPSTFVTVDEARIPSHAYGTGQLTFNPQKPKRWALELCTVNDESKYLFDFTLPKEYTAFQALIHFGERLSTHGIPFHITADTHFSNLEQLRKLQNLNIHCTLACSRNSAPAYLFKEGLAKGLPFLRTRMAKTNRVVAACYHRSKVICLLSTWFQLDSVPKADAKARAPLLAHYDETKRFCDQFNQLVAAYHFNHKHQDVEHTLLTGLFEFAVTNSYIMYNNNVSNAVSHRNYLFDCAAALLS